MTWTWQELLGFIGGILINAAFVPQVYRLFKIKSAREISLAFTTMMVIGGLFWLSYGIVLAKASIIISNVVAVTLSSLMLFAKLRYGKRRLDEKHT